MLTAAGSGDIGSQSEDTLRIEINVTLQILFCRFLQTFSFKNPKKNLTVNLIDTLYFKGNDNLATRRQAL